MENGKATAWLTLADADAVEQKVLDVLNRVFGGDITQSTANRDALAQRLAGSFYLQNAVANYIRPEINNMLRDGLKNNLKVEHYYEQWNRVAGYRIRYGDTTIQQEQIKIGY